MRLSNIGNTLEKPIDELSLEHINVLLEIWDINRNNFTHAPGPTDVAVAFGDNCKYSLNDQVVSDLFDWKYLKWVEEGKVFIISGEIIFSDLTKQFWDLTQHHGDASD